MKWSIQYVDHDCYDELIDNFYDLATFDESELTITTATRVFFTASLTSSSFFNRKQFSTVMNHVTPKIATQIIQLILIETFPLRLSETWIDYTWKSTSGVTFRRRPRCEPYFTLYSLSKKNDLLSLFNSTSAFEKILFYLEYLIFGSNSMKSAFNNRMSR